MLHGNKYFKPLTFWPARWLHFTLTTVSDSKKLSDPNFAMGLMILDEALGWWMGNIGRAFFNLKKFLMK